MNEEKLASQKNALQSNNLEVSKDTQLSALQQQMQQSLLTPFLQENQLAFINTEIKPSPRMSAKAHFSIYQRSYVMRLQQCMDSQFTALKYALGDELFHLFVHQYLHTYPSNNYSLNNLGDNFSYFLQQTRPDAEQEEKEHWPDFMIELASFEHSLNHLFDQEIPNELLDHQQIPAEQNTPDSHLSLVPVLKLFHQKHPIFAYYRAFNDQLSPDLPLPKNSYGMLIRRNYRLGIIDVNYGQFLFIKTLIEQKSIEKTKQALVNNHGYNNQVINDLWTHWRKYLIEMGAFNQE